jgi:integrase
MNQMNQLQKIQIFEKENSELTNKKIESKLNFILKGQEMNQRELRLGFIGLAQRNQELLDSNQELSQQLKLVAAELNILKQEREEKTNRKNARANRKRLPKRDPMTAEIYTKLMRAAEGPTYINLRTRMALCILAVTGIRINELLPLKVNQLQTLVEESWIAIDRSKRGPSNHKAFLTKEGKKIIQDRQKDFQLIFLMKESDSYVFTSEANHSQILRRETPTKDVNKVMRLVSDQLSDKPNITSHSFRIGYITQLWKDSKDIEFVKQSIGHRKLDTTSAYVENLSDRERQERINKIDFNNLQ